MRRAILFDFDGVLADTEPIHQQMFHLLLQEEGIDLTDRDYYEHYLGLDDRACFRQIFADRGRKLEEGKIAELVKKKNEKVLAILKERSLLIDGASKAVKGLEKEFYLAVVSGALRNEVEEVLRKGGLFSSFRVIVGADDIQESKPDPEGFLTAFKWLNRDYVPSSEVLFPEECVVIEDSPWGIEAAKKAGMISVGVTHSYPAERLQGADRIVGSIQEVTPTFIRKL